MFGVFCLYGNSAMNIIISIKNDRCLNECNFLIFTLHSLSTEVSMLSNCDSYGCTVTQPHKASAWNVPKNPAPLLSTMRPPRGYFTYEETLMKKSIHPMSSYHSMVVRLEVISGNEISLWHKTTALLNEKFPKKWHAAKPCQVNESYCI